MTALMRTLISMLSSGKSKAEISVESMEKRVSGGTAREETTATAPPASQEGNAPVIKPLKRTVIQAPEIAADAADARSPDKILIKAQPSPSGDQCVFMVNRPLFKGYSWWFPNFEAAEGSPLAETLFSLDGVETVLAHDSTATVTRIDKSPADWLPLAREIGAAIRRLLESGASLIAEKITREMPAEEKIRADIQRVIDAEVNPGVAGHGGRITLVGVQGNTVTIQMGGGCQGCSAADVTLKMGIHNAFRKAVPGVGAIYDETDHSAGLNPYFS